MLTDHEKYNVFGDEILEEIKRMQDNLLLIRRTVGWSAAEFGDKIGVTRQTINNIENGRNKLNKTQYIAMRSVLDAEIESCPNDTEMLKTLLEVLIDNPDNYSKEMRKELADKANLMVPGILVGSVTRKKVSEEWMLVAATVAGAALLPLPVAALGAVSVSAWLRKINKKTKECKRKEDSSADKIKEKEQKNEK